MADSQNINDRLDEAFQRRLALQPEIIEPEAFGRARCQVAQIYIGDSKPQMAVACCGDALKVCNREQHPAIWARANFLAGEAYLEWLDNRIYHLELALTYFEAAAEVYIEATYPDQWIDTNIKLRRTRLLIHDLKVEERMESVWGQIKSKMDENLCFVMMPFSDEAVAGVYEHIIKPVIEGNGLNPSRADSFKKATPIMPDVWQGITTSRVLIAELTNFNANVYYELGLCHALNKKPILMIQKGQALPFDLASFRTIFYSTDLSGSDEARKVLDEFIKEALSASE